MDKVKANKIFSLAIKKIFNLKIKESDTKNLSSRELKTLTHLLEEEFTLQFGIAGKAGSGKTTTLNALFGLNEKVGHVEAGTKNVQSYTRNLGEGKSTIVFHDFPGLQDSAYLDKIIMKDYDKLLPKCDVILWLVQSTDRSLSFDEEYIRHMPPILKNKIVVGLSQVDNIHPGNWNLSKKLPSADQYKVIVEKKKNLAKRFDLDITRIVEFCAFETDIYQIDGSVKNINKKFNLLHLVNILLKACEPDNQFLLDQSFTKKIFQLFN